MESNLSLYRIFITTAECENISAAARKLYISQPAVSKAISKLESNLGVPLFARIPKGVILTNEGKMLYEKVKFAFTNIEKGEELVKNMMLGNGGQLKIGASTTLIRHVLLNYLNKFRTEYPSIHLSVESQSSYKTIKLLNDGKIDIGLIGISNDIKALPQNMKYTQIGEIEDIFVCNPDYLKEKSEKNIFEESSLILLDEENLTRKYINHYLMTNNIDTQRIIEATSMDVLLDFAKIKMGIACAIKQFIKEELEKKELVEVNVGIRIPKRSIGFVYYPDSLPSEAARKFIDYFEL